MKTTIRSKLFLFFVGFMLLFILTGAALNGLLLEKFYVFKNESIFQEVAAQVKASFETDQSDVSALIQQIDRLDGIGIAVTRSVSDILYSSYPAGADAAAMKVPKEIQELIGARGRELARGPVYTLLPAQEDQSAKLIYVMRLTNQNLLIMTKPLKGIQESSAISNQFYVFSGLLLTLLGGLLMFLMSKKMTRPIVEMSGVAKRISLLEFDAKASAEARDEIGDLARSINSISDKLKISMDALRGEVEAQKTLARNLSHELKTPIGIVKGYAEGLLYGVADSPEMKAHYCKVIADECDRMDALVRELLDLSALESGSRADLASERVSVGDLVEGVVRRFAPVFTEAGISCSVQLEPDLEVQGSRELLERALANVVINAVKYCDGAKQIRITAGKADGRMMLSVENTGQPIPGEELPRIFEVFYTADKARTRGAGGHGLGLAIVRSITSLHDGTVCAENLPDGVAVRIFLPLDQVGD